MRLVQRITGSYRLSFLALAAVALVSASAVALPGGAPQTAAGAPGQVHHLSRTSHAPDRRNPHYCDGCTPPLLYANGPVMAASPDSPMTITPVFWAPGGDAHVFPPGYESAVSEYLTNVAAASGSTDNVYSVVTEYYGLTHGTKSNLAYAIEAGTPIDDASPYPSEDCSAETGYDRCLTDAQLRAELTKLRIKAGISTGLDSMFVVFLPPGVDLVDRDDSHSATEFCGYHRAYGNGASVVVYAAVPYADEGCDAGQAPNGSIAVESAINSTSHEVIEAITDPAEPIAWTDSSGNEIADICADVYGPVLGSTDPARAGRTEFNQVINGGHYYTQTEFSNYAFAQFGTGHGCVQSEADARKAPSGTTGKGQIDSVFLEGSPIGLPANGTAKSTINLSVGDAQGRGIPGDPVHFQVYPRSGSGTCGRLGKANATTDDSGFASVTYTASRANVICVITAVEGTGGQLAKTLVYQGTTGRAAPTMNVRFPTALTPGASPVVFSVTLHNPVARPLTNTRLDLAFFAATAKSIGVSSSQIRLSYSKTGPNGPFRPIVLTGSTKNDGEIDGFPGPEAGTTLAGHTKVTMWFRISLMSSVPTTLHGEALLSIEAYLDQIDPATGSGSMLGDSYATDIVAR